MELWVFGDSFASSTIQHDEFGIHYSSDWFSLLAKEFLGDLWFNEYCPARDVQTIMDNFYKNLHNIKEDSLVIVWLPSMARLRYPKKEIFFETNSEASYCTNSTNIISGEIQNFDKIEYFSHWPYLDYPSGIARPELDFPFDSFDFDDLDKTKSVTYDYFSSFSKQSIKQKIEEGISPIDFSKLLVANNATKENWNDIFNSLKKFCKFEILFVSWTDEYNSQNVVGKNKLTKEIGIWHTQHDEYNETNGESGLEWDEHFSTKMNENFAKWIIKKYPKYFKQ